MNAQILELVQKNLKPGAKVLNACNQCGYLSAAFYELCKDPENPDNTVVVSIDRQPEKSLNNLNKSYHQQIQ